MTNRMTFAALKKKVHNHHAVHELQALFAND